MVNEDFKTKSLACFSDAVEEAKAAGKDFWQCVPNVIRVILVAVLVIRARCLH